MSALSKECRNCGRKYTDDSSLLHGTTRWRICDEGNLYFNCACGSTLVLPSGAFDWHMLTKALRPPVASLFRQLQSRHRLPFLPAALLDLQRSLSDPNSGVERQTQAAAADPLLAAEIVRFANAVKGEGVSPLTTLPHAISYMGREMLGEIVLIAAIKSLSTNTYHYTARVYWRDAILTGLLAESIASTHAKHLDPKRAFFAGALCNVGKFVGTFYIPEQIDAIHLELARSSTGALTWTDIERRLDVPSHCLLGEIAAVMWGLPPFVFDAVAHHHRWADLKPDLPLEPLSLAELAALANQLSHLVASRAFRMEKPLVEAIIHRAGLPEASQLVTNAADLLRRTDQLLI